MFGKFVITLIYKNKLIGRVTCKDTSLVDYLILSSNLFHILADFEVFPFNPMFSDVHNHMHSSLYFSHKKWNTPDSVKKNNTYVGWNSTKADDFTQILHNDNSKVVLTELNTLIDNINIDSVTPEQVNGIFNYLGNVLLNAASSDKINEGKKVTLVTRGIIHHDSMRNVRFSGIKVKSKIY